MGGVCHGPNLCAHGDCGLGLLAVQVTQGVARQKQMSTFALAIVIAALIVWGVLALGDWVDRNTRPPR